MSLPRHSILQPLNPSQRRAVTSRARAVLVIAGAGTGKTRTLVHRVGWLVAEGIRPQRILLLTFTRKAAAEMLERARTLHPGCQGVEGGTFHSLCYRLLKAYGTRIGLENFSVLDQADTEQIIARLVRELASGRPRQRLPRARSIAGLISRARNTAKALEELVEGWEHAQLALDTARAYAQYKADHRLLDYDDLLERCVQLLESPWAAEALRGRWEHVLVDEYQDTNAIQARILQLLAKGAQGVMAVGDDAQSIYRFRGARHRNILEFPELFPGCEIIRLEQSYRCQPRILALANAIMARQETGFTKELFSHLPPGPPPSLHRPRDERGQSELVASRIAELISSGTEPGEIGVLMRAGRDSFDLEVELSGRGIGFVKYGGVRLTQAAHIKDVLAMARVVANPADAHAWERLLGLIPAMGPKRVGAALAALSRAPDPIAALGRLPECRPAPMLQSLARVLAEMADPALEPAEVLETAIEFYRQLAPNLYEDHARRLSELEELVGVASGYNDLEEMLAQLALEPPEQAAEPARGRVVLSTIHSAKGLEWEHVFVIWACEGRLPAAGATDPEALAEERRLVYVACTRARSSLTIVAPLTSYTRNGPMPMRLSRFLEGIDPGVLAHAQPLASVAAASPAPLPQPLPRPKGPIPPGAIVEHQVFGRGRVMGSKGGEKVIVEFEGWGLKVLSVKHAPMRVVDR